MSIKINKLGDNIIVKLLKIENYKYASALLDPPIQSMKYVRALCNAKCILQVDFVEKSYALDNGVLKYEQLIVAGDDSLWFKVENEMIYKFNVSLFNITSELSELETIEILFEFVREIPREYDINPIFN